MLAHALWRPNIQMHGVSYPLPYQQINKNLPVSTTRNIHNLSQLTNVQTPCISDADCDEVQDTSSVLCKYLMERLSVSLPIAEFIVHGAPSFVQDLVAITKEQQDGEVESGNGCGFPEKIQRYLDHNSISLLEPILESIGSKGKFLQRLFTELSECSVQSFISLIKVFDNLGIPMSCLETMIRKDEALISCTEEEIIAGFQALKDLVLSDDELLKLILRYPLILKAYAIRNIDLVFSELEEFKSRDSIITRAVCSDPHRIHTYERGCAKEAIEYLKSYGFSVLRLDYILQKHARIILTDVEKKLKRNVQFLEDIGLSRDLIYKVINRCPNFLFYSVEDNCEAKLEYFKELGFEEPEFCRVIAKYPNLFSASLENKIKPAIEELRTLCLSEEGLKKVVLCRPCLFAYRLGGDISVLVKELNRSSFEESGKVTAFIKLYSRHAEHKLKCENCLVQHGLSATEATMLLEREPSILGYSEHILHAKLEMLKHFGIPIQTLLKLPEYLSFALRKRIQRRERVLSYLKSKGLLAGEVTMKQLVLHSNTLFYSEYVKPYSGDTELCNIWYKKRDAPCNLSASCLMRSDSEAQSVQ
ncbi:hypothetical protein KP509_12G024700 [Ceratopteris richardii]|nr:hypothetical protein KP509_12G024700 [Ceratopteris richardii]